MDKTSGQRQALLTSLGHSIVSAAAAGAFGRKFEIRKFDTVAGPRAGAVEFHAGLHSGDLVKALSASDAAILRQFVPWEFTGDPACYMSGRYVRCEAGWPSHLTEYVVRLPDLAKHPTEGGVWTAGKNEVGRTVTLHVGDDVPHWLFSGTTGSGKSVALRSAAAQLARDEGNRLVLLDGKYGDGLGVLDQLPFLVGPPAQDLEDIRAALLWTAAEMRRRYETGDKSRTKVVIIFDEFQELLGKAGDAQVRELTRRIIAQGRGANIHCLLATHHPTIDAFGEASIKRNLVGRVALKVGDAKASEVAIGASTPRADHLLGAGDAYAVRPGALHRVQLAYVDHVDIAELPVERPYFLEWPEITLEDALGSLPEDLDAGRVNWSYDSQELALGLLVAAWGRGRPTLTNLLEKAGLGRPGAERAIRLLQQCRGQYEALLDMGFALCKQETGTAIAPFVGQENR